MTWFLWQSKVTTSMRSSVTFAQPANFRISSPSSFSFTPPSLPAPSPLRSSHHLAPATARFLCQWWLKGDTISSTDCARTRVCVVDSEKARVPRANGYGAHGVWTCDRSKWPLWHGLFTCLVAHVIFSIKIIKASAFFTHGHESARSSGVTSQTVNVVCFCFVCTWINAKQVCVREASPSVCSWQRMHDLFLSWTPFTPFWCALCHANRFLFIQYVL